MASILHATSFIDKIKKFKHTSNWLTCCLCQQGNHHSFPHFKCSSVANQTLNHIDSSSPFSLCRTKIASYQLIPIDYYPCINIDFMVMVCLLLYMQINSKLSKLIRFWGMNGHGNRTNKGRCCLNNAKRHTVVIITNKSRFNYKFIWNANLKIKRTNNINVFSFQFS